MPEDAVEAWLAAVAFEDAERVWDLDGVAVAGRLADG